MSELSELADRVEALGGPDRALDVLAAEAANWRDGIVRQYRAASPTNTTAVMAQAAIEGRDEFSDLPRYTNSLDAAMTLVPPCKCYDGATEKYAFDIWAREGGTLAACYPDDDTDVKGRGKTPALALCAAALRARDMESEDAG